MAVNFWGGLDWLALFAQRVTLMSLRDSCHENNTASPSVGKAFTSSAYCPKMNAFVAFMEYILPGVEEAYPAPST